MRLWEDTWAEFVQFLSFDPEIRRVVCSTQCDGVHLRHRPPPDKVTKGPGSRAAGLAMAFKLIESARDRWRAVNAPHLVAMVRYGATFTNGKLVERPDESTTRAAA